MKQFVISENDAFQRLDKFMKKLLPQASSSLIYKINRKNKIKVNGKKEDNEYKLQIGDEVKVFLTDEDFKILMEKKWLSSDSVSSQLDKKNIVYEDGDILVLNKEPWINVHPWDHKTKESNVISQVQDYLWDKLNSLTFKPSLIHRIDRDTSWILMIGKKKEILTQLVSDFKEHKKVKKVYYALVLWKLPHASWVIDKKLLRIEWAKNEDKVQVSDSGQTAISHYKVLQEYTLNTPQQEYIISEVEVEILTWRMHQIRVHLASEWCPIIWDNKYGNKVMNTYFSKHFDQQRQCLHAWKIEFFHYGKQKNMILQAKIKSDLEKFLQLIREKKSL